MTVKLLSELPDNIHWLFFLFSRAVNNDVIETYQLKSLDGLVENNMENLAIIQQGGKKLSDMKRFYLLSKHLYENLKEMNSTYLMKDVLQKHEKERETFFWQKPYNRVIRCTGFRFNFSIFDRYSSTESGAFITLHQFALLTLCLPLFTNTST